MKAFNNTTYITIALVAILGSCASSMTPIHVNNRLPDLTAFEFLSKAEADEYIAEGRCKYLVQGRSYVAPVGFTTNHDLKNAAKGIDEWIAIDGGNAYVLNNYQWITIDDQGTTQLLVEFDTMLCN